MTSCRFKFSRDKWDELVYINSKFMFKFLKETVTVTADKYFVQLTACVNEKRDSTSV